MIDSAAPTPYAASDLVAIAAIGANRVIGDGHDQPWSHRDDFARFKRLTRHQVLIMGRRTYDAIGRPLPGRLTVVLTRDPDWWPADVERPATDRPRPTATDLAVAATLADADALAGDRRPGAVRFVAGGGEIYRLAWDSTTVLELTEVDHDLPGDVTFPAVDPAHWTEVAREPRVGFAWVTYRRTP